MIFFGKYKYKLEGVVSAWMIFGVLYKQLLRNYALTLIRFGKLESG
jgi:hypothetical protein